MRHHEVKIDCAGLSNVGLKRKNNEDQFLVADLNRSIVVRQTTLEVEKETVMLGSTEGKLLIVADGAGGHASGERASELAVHTITHFALNTMGWFVRADERYEQDLVEDLQAGLSRCQQILARDAATHPENRRMATTLTMAYIYWPRIYILHVGDSRTYLLRDDELHQITQDHTYADNLADSRFAGVLWNALVGDDDNNARPEVHKAELEYGDSLLLCTDGLNKHVTDIEIKQELARFLPAADTADRMIELANGGGGTDNTTVVIARFLQPGSSSPSP